MTNLRLEDLASEFGKALGENNYRVGVNCDIDPSGDKIQVVLYATRKPYKIEGINSEVLDVYLEIYMPVLVTEQKQDILAQIHKALNGYKMFNIMSAGEEFKAFSFLDFTRPLQAPMVDTGTIMQLTALQGSVLITGQKGALIGNEIKTYLIFNPEDAERTLEGEVNVLNSSVTLNKETESPQMATDVMAKSYNRSQVYNYSYTLLLMKNTIGKRLIQGMLGIAPFRLNERVDIREVYPAFDSEGEIAITNQYIITSCQLDKSAGAFATIQITLQDKLEL